MKRSWLVFAGALALLAPASPARAEPVEPPVVTLTVSGTCPEAARVTQAVSSYVEVAAPGDQAAWSITVTGLRGAAHIVIRDGHGATAVDRDIASDDCAALADACAIIVYAHFVRLGLVVEEAGSEPGPRASPAPAPLPRSIESLPSSGLPDAPPTGPVSRDAAAAPAAPAASPRATTQPGRPTESAQFAVRPPGLVREDSALEAPGARLPARRRMGLAMLGGLDVASSEPLFLSGVGRLDVTLALPHRLAGRAGLSMGLFSHALEPAELRRRQALCRVDLGTRIEWTGFWLFPAVSAGLAASRVTTALAMPTGNEEHSSLRVHPVLGAGLGAGRRIAERVWLRADLDVTLYPVVERYFVDSIGEIARSPRASAAFLAGIEWDL